MPLEEIVILHHIAVKIINAKIIDVILKEQKIINYHEELLNGLVPLV